MHDNVKDIMKAHTWKTQCNHSSDSICTMLSDGDTNISPYSPSKKLF